MVKEGVYALLTTYRCNVRALYAGGFVCLFACLVGWCVCLGFFGGRLVKNVFSVFEFVFVSEGSTINQPMNQSLNLFDICKIVDNCSVATMDNT